MTARAGYDLHTHSAISDGTTSPSDIASEAARVGLEGFALTDHDTVDGWDEARAAASELGIDFVPGIEVTTRFGGGSRHVLGYGIDAVTGELFDALTRVRESRLSRARHMVKLISADYRITWDEVSGATPAVTIGRPHIADALVSAGYFVDRSTAFAEILHPGSQYYVPTYAIATDEAIRLIRMAGGVAVLAHPAANRQRAAVASESIRTFAASGLWGIELDHPENREEWLPPLRALATELDLEVTGSSDYHGGGKPNRLGERRTPASLVARLRELVKTPR